MVTAKSISSLADHLQTTARRRLVVALGNGNGTFQPPSIIAPQGFGFVGPLAVADFTGDGKLDVYADGIFPGNGDGTLQSINDGHLILVIVERC
jgi:hypothetical protein